MLSFCDQKLSNVPPGMDQDTWNLLKLWFVEEPRTEMLKFIGFKPPEKEAAAPSPPAPDAAPPPPPPPDAPEQSAEDLFGSLAATAGEDTSLAAQDEAAAAQAARVEQLATVGSDEAPAAQVVPSESWATAADGESIKRALIVGDYETAVECCLRAVSTHATSILALDWSKYNKQSSSCASDLLDLL